MFELARQIVHRLAVGFGDLEGNDVATMFANAIGGDHRASPLGVADVEWNGCAWTIKTVQNPKPFAAEGVRLISGRCSPDYSLGITDPHADPQATGRAVLSIWNARVNEALGEHDDLRTGVLVRKISRREFVLFEEETSRFIPDDYSWDFTERRTLWGYDRSSGRHAFVWQPHGSQFTIMQPIPPSARRFSIARNVPMIEVGQVLEDIGFDSSWIDIEDG